MRFDRNLVARAFAAKEFGDTVRAMLVLLLAFSVVAALLTFPFVLKRILFNLYPAAKERMGSAVARDHAFSVEGLYVLEEQVFLEVGLPRPKEGRWDLLFQNLSACVAAPPQLVPGLAGSRCCHVMGFNIGSQYGRSRQHQRVPSGSSLDILCLAREYPLCGVRCPSQTGCHRLAEA